MVWVKPPEQVVKVFFMLSFVTFHSQQPVLRYREALINIDFTQCLTGPRGRGRSIKTVALIKED